MIRNYTSMILSLVAAVLLSIPSVAEEPAPQLFIERIEVRNHRRVSPDVVIAESRLREGREYSEAELRDASTRLSRLPFLLSVDFALERGSERGRHVLVLTINETKPFFFFADARQYFDDGGRVDVDYNDRLSTTGSMLALGYRWFVGRRGAVHVGFSAENDESELRKEYASVAVGYTQYDLFGTRAFATLNVKLPIEGYGEGSISPQLVVGIPLSANQTLALELDETRFDRHSVEKPRDGASDRRISARWSYNTTNQPHLPTDGTLLSIGPTMTWSDGASGLGFVNEDGSHTHVRLPTHSNVYGVEGSAARYWELTERDSVFGDLRGEVGRSDSRIPYPEGTRTIKGDIVYGSAGFGYSRSLWSREERANGDSRFEGTFRYSHRERPIGDYFYSNDTMQGSAAWVRRSSWGTLRLGAGYAW